ncbi:MAG: oxidoreductase domain protein [Armatimonadetes bacterium]|nr:oxidoreductase domain protein [Armatimonadota bacterium]
MGCGGMGRSLGRQLNTIEQARIIGVADVSTEAIARASEELKAPGFENIEALISRPDVGAVIVATPGFLHRQYTELAAAQGKHVFVEKPMATNLADCDAMMAAVDAAGVKMMVGQVLRYYPTWWQILELVRQGEIGQPLGVTTTRISGGWNGWPVAWRNSLDLSGGLLMEVNAHEIDFMCQLCGEVERVYAEADHFGDDPADYPNLYFVSLRFKSGAVGMLHSSTIAAVNDLTGKVQGAEGTIIYTDGFGPSAEIRYARRNGEQTKIRVPDIQVEQPVRKELRLFVEALLNDTPVPITPREGRHNVAIALAAYESARTGLPVVP